MKGPFVSVTSGLLFNPGDPQVVKHSTTLSLAFKYAWIVSQTVARIVTLNNLKIYMHTYFSHISVLFFVNYTGKRKKDEF